MFSKIETFVFGLFALTILLALGFVIKQFRDSTILNQRATEACAPFQVYYVNSDRKEVVCYTLDNSVVIKHL